jgi:hypothetical protein
MKFDDYSDIIDLPYPRDDWNFLMKHPRMSMQDRAKIFAPFAALRGHSTALAKTAEQKLDSVEHEFTLEDPDSVMPDAGDENF